MTTRTEHDLLGEMALPADALYGIHAARAVENFPLSGRRVHPALIRAYGAVKLACATANHELGYLNGPVFEAVARACREMDEGMLGDHVVVDALQGGAGTSTNMNVNEVLANRALQILGEAAGSYGIVSPHEHLNLHQSTNDTYPTALKVAAVRELRQLEPAVVALMEAFQEKEKQFSDVVKVARTQLQDAVLITLGREMSAYAEAFARDRWRIYKSEERLRQVNLGGTAIGTGLLAPRKYIFRVVEDLRAITGLGLARAENLVEATQNNDAFVEASGILKTCASNLLKIASDLRLLSSGPEAGFNEIRLPARQAGSSIMPGKVNPVIPEAVTQAALSVIGNDNTLALSCGMGNLELNAFLPLVADCLLTSIDLLRNACAILRRHCVEGLEADRERCARHVNEATACLTALVEPLGYEKAEAIAKRAAADGRSVREVVLAEGLLTAEEFDRLISPERVNMLGSRETT